MNNERFNKPMHIKDIVKHILDGAKQAHRELIKKQEEEILKEKP